MQKVDIWTDGSVNMKNDNKCSWAFVCKINDNFIFEDSALLTEDNRTGNIAEMTAIMQAIIWLNKICEQSDVDPKTLDVDIYSDSQYCVKGINIWVKNWKLKNFQNVKNRPYWEEFYKLNYNHNFGKLSINWIKGHSDIPENERADYLCGILTKTSKSFLKKSIPTI